jgi:hypothetical protein
MAEPEELLNCTTFVKRFFTGLSPPAASDGYGCTRARIGLKRRKWRRGFGRTQREGAVAADNTL